MQDEENHVRRRVVIREGDDDVVLLNEKDRVGDAGCYTTEGEADDEDRCLKIFHSISLFFSSFHLSVHLLTELLT
ncbi:unnamed protein product [Heligmosomoides polygyrus]|uniref:Uncharacterized protein n=1 Tax=Heligmosomoides polygyrus TaxID=6339 RepID=A0A183FBQ9_HELPZ|nr:unnamed protein product [Heligmosomoides polygyrus]